jgi:hypothetical protein
MIKSLYDLMGEHVRPKIDDEAKEQHIEAVLKVFKNDLLLFKIMSTLNYLFFHLIN